MGYQTFKKSFLFLCLGCLISSAAYGFTPNLYIDIKLTKDTFSIGEPVEGLVIINSTIPGTYPVNFRTRLFKDDKTVSESITNAPVFLGETKFELKTFLDAASMHYLEQAGKWRIEISTSSSHNVSSEAEFSVSP